MLLIGGSTPRATTSDFTLTLLVMVVLGEAGSRWGAVLGGILYTYLDNRLGELAGSETIADLPAVLRVPLSEPLFILGVLFILIVFFVPGGIAGPVGRLRRHRSGRGKSDSGDGVPPPAGLPSSSVVKDGPALPR